MKHGEVAILNVGAGDTKLSFDPANPQDRIRASRIIKDMLRRGYALLVQSGLDDKGNPTFTRALEFDETKFEYIIADFDPTVSTDDHGQEKPQEPGEEITTPTTKRRGRPPKRVAGGGARVVAVAPSAGG